MADDKPTEELLVYICHTEHRLWVGGDYSGFWLTVRVGDTSYKRRPEMPEHYNTFIYKLQS